MLVGGALREVDGGEDELGLGGVVEAGEEARGEVGLARGAEAVLEEEADGAVVRVPVWKSNLQPDFNVRV